MNYLEIIIIFFSILFKYLLSYGISKNLLYLFIGFICLLIALDIKNIKITKKEFGKILIFLIISMYFVIMQQDVNFLISLIFSIIIMKKNNHDFIKIFFISSIILYIVTIILYLLNILPDANMIRYVDGVIQRRYSLGFSHPNEVFLFYLPIVLSGYYLFHHKKLYYIIIILISFILYKLSLCRTGFYTVIIFLILVKIYPQKTIKKSKSYLLKNIFLIFTVFSILIAYLYGNDLTNNISRLLSGRPFYWNYYITHNKMFTIFGNNKTEGYYLDNFYIYLLVQLGIIGTYIYYKINKISISKLSQDRIFIIILLTFLIYGFTEANVIIGSINFIFAIQIKTILINNRSNITRRSSNENKYHRTNL